MKKDYKSPIIKRRIIFLALTLIFLAIFIIFLSIILSAKPIKDRYLYYVIFSSIIATLFLVFFTMSLTCKVREFEVRQYKITIVELIVARKIYVNGHFAGDAFYSSGKGGTHRNPCSFMMSDGAVITITPLTRTKYKVAIGNNGEIINL